MCIGHHVRGHCRRKNNCLGEGFIYLGGWFRVGSDGALGLEHLVFHGLRALPRVQIKVLTIFFQCMRMFL